jgi:hypothetical protein
VKSTAVEIREWDSEIVQKQGKHQQDTELDDRDPVKCRLFNYKWSISNAE